MSYKCPNKEGYRCPKCHNTEFLRARYPAESLAIITCTPPGCGWKDVYHKFVYRDVDKFLKEQRDDNLRGMFR